MKGLIISADEFEDLELFYPYHRLLEEGIEVHIASIAKGKIKGKHDYSTKVHLKAEEVNPSEYDFLIIPGGKAPAKLRKNEKILDIARDFSNENKLIAAICHGPQILISADLMEGRKATSYESVKSELVEAGANYVDQEVVIDKNLITSRKPSDLPAFMREVLKNIK
ncbi:MAG: type 1 glutamine amidotransferase [Hadesarchaea archaeon]|nr:type 1 glutamine amidotransferase [Hadesarchaea archaeon]